MGLQKLAIVSRSRAAGSWWVQAPRPGFTELCDSHKERMRGTVEATFVTGCEPFAKVKVYRQAGEDWAA